MSFAFAVPPAADRQTIRDAIVLSNRVVTPDNRQAIMAAMNAAASGTTPAGLLNGLTSDAQRNEVLLAFALACADQGASNETNIQGSFRGISFADIKSNILRHGRGTTLRQWCRYFAKVVWNEFVMTDRDPANWAQKGFSNATKKAAWDFFDGIGRPDVLQVALHRAPTNDELTIYNANTVALIDRNIRQRYQEGVSSTLAEFSRGQTRASAPRGLLTSS